MATLNMTDEAAQLINWARQIAIMTETQFLRHYNHQLSITARRQLATFPAVNYQEKTCAFPWVPTGTVNITQERTPSPDRGTGYIEQMEVVNEVPVATLSAVVNEPPATEAPSRREASDSSDDNYQPPRTTNRNPPQQWEEAESSPQQSRNETERVQYLLQTFAPKLRYPENRRNEFETEQYQQLQQTQETEHEEMIAKLFLNVKENLALAFGSETRASFHHF